MHVWCNYSWHVIMCVWYNLGCHDKDMIISGPHKQYDKGVIINASTEECVCSIGWCMWVWGPMPRILFREKGVYAGYDYSCPTPGMV